MRWFTKVFCTRMLCAIPHEIVISSCGSYHFQNSIFYAIGYLFHKALYEFIFCQWKMSNIVFKHPNIVLVVSGGRDMMFHKFHFTVSYTA